MTDTWKIFWIPDSAQRKNFYEYLETHHPSIRFQGTLVEHLPYQSYCFDRCGYGCDGTIYFTSYQKGLMENNEDESSYGVCDKCGLSRDHDHYDEPLPCICRNNVVVINSCHIKGAWPSKEIPKGDEFFNRKRMKKYLYRIKGMIHKHEFCSL